MYFRLVVNFYTSTYSNCILINSRGWWHVKYISDMADIRPFQIDIPKEEVDRLNRKLKDTTPKTTNCR